MILEIIAAAMFDLSGQGFLESLRNFRIQREVNRPKKFDPPKFFAGISSEGKYLIEQLGKGVVAADGYLGARSLTKGQAIAVREGRIDERPAPVVAEAPRLETTYNPAVLLRVSDGAGNYTYWVAYKSDRVQIATVPAGQPTGGGGGGGATLTWNNITADYGNGMTELTPTFANDGRTIQIDEGGQVLGREIGLLSDPFTVSENTDLRGWFAGDLSLGCLGADTVTNYIAFSLVDASVPPGPTENLATYAFNNEVTLAYELYYDWFAFDPSVAPNPTTATVSKATPDQYYEEFPPFDSSGFGDPSIYVQAPTVLTPFVITPGEYRLSLFASLGNADTVADDWYVNGSFEIDLGGAAPTPDSFIIEWTDITVGTPLTTSINPNGFQVSINESLADAYSAALDLESASFRTNEQRSLTIWFDGTLASNGFARLEIYATEVGQQVFPAWEYQLAVTGGTAVVGELTAPFDNGVVDLSFGTSITGGPNGSNPPATFVMEAAKNYEFYVLVRSDGANPGDTFSINGTVHFAMDPAPSPPLPVASPYLSMGKSWHAGIVEGEEKMYYRSAPDAQTATAIAPATLTPSPDDWRGARLAYPPLPTPGQTCVEQYRDNNFANLHNNKLLLIDPAQNVTVGGSTVALSDAILTNAVSGAFTVQAAVDDNGVCTTSPARTAKVRFPKLLTGPLEGVDPSLVEVSAIAIAERRQTRR